LLRKPIALRTTHGTAAEPNRPFDLYCNAEITLTLFTSHAGDVHLQKFYCRQFVFSSFMWIHVTTKWLKTLCGYEHEVQLLTLSATMHSVTDGQTNNISMPIADHRLSNSTIRQKWEVQWVEQRMVIRKDGIF